MNRLRERSRPLWARVRRELEAAAVPADQQAALARQARRQLRLRRHAWKQGVYEAQGVGGLVLHHHNRREWQWLHP